MRLDISKDCSIQKTWKPHQNSVYGFRVPRRPTRAVLQVFGYDIKKNNKRGARHGPSEMTTDVL